MKPLRLYIQDFLCYSKCFIDFDKFEASLIVAKINDSDELSNGAGKTTIFKAIGYCLFNEIDLKMESIIRDDCDSCQVVFDFEDNNTVYRVLRKRTKKSSDFSLFKKINNDSSDCHLEDDSGYYTPLDATKFKDGWMDLSATRLADTEKELFKIINTNYKSFINTVHFAQNDFSGIATATPQQRKQILKDALELTLYSKLEKLAKEKFSKLSKDFDKVSILIESTGDVDEQLSNLSKQLLENSTLLNKSSNDNLLILENEKLLNENYLLINNKLIEMKNSIQSLLSSKNSLNSELIKLEESFSDLTIKNNKNTAAGKLIVEKIDELTAKKEKLSLIDISLIESLSKENDNLKQQISDNNSLISSNLTKYNDLIVPLPDDDLCKHCRQIMSKEHKESCKQTINIDIQNCKKIMNESKIKNNELNTVILKNNSKINELNSVKLSIDTITNEINLKKNDLVSKKSLHKEYKTFLKSQSEVIDNKKKSLEVVILEINKSGIEEINKTESLLNEEKIKLNKLLSEKQVIVKNLTHANNSKAVIENSISEKIKDKDKLSKLLVQKNDLQLEMQHYPSVISAFGASGIPNLIIQNILEDLQNEANKLLDQLKPGLQLNFIVEKETSDADTLDINYFVSGKKRYYEQLSGAMKLAVGFSLKLGLSFLLQKMMGFNIPLLLLDEIDQSLDKGGVDSFVDIIRFFQKEFKILIITHNDRLKDKIPDVIMVNQDRNKVSQAKVM